MAFPITDDRQLYFSFQPDDPMVAAQISDCLTLQRQKCLLSWPTKHFTTPPFS